MSIRRGYMSEFRVNGAKMLAPDMEPTFSYEDIDGPDTGRTLDGVMHRYVVRYKVGKWEFTYSNISDDERDYMEGIFPDAASFDFIHPSRTDANAVETSTCYRSKCSMDWKSKKTGTWNNYKFDIIEV